MEMTTTNVTLRILRPSDGKWLTRKIASDDEGRIFSTEVYLGSNDSQDNWMEVDNAYKADYEKRLAEELNGGNGKDGRNS